MVSFARAVRHTRLHRVDDPVSMADRDLRLHRDGDGVERAAACDLPSAAVLDRASAGDAAVGPYRTNFLRHLPFSRAPLGWIGGQAAFLQPVYRARPLPSGLGSPGA